MLNFHEFRKTPNRLSDVLPWAAMVSPETILNKDGSFQSVIKYRGPDLESSTEEELIIKASHVNNILRRLGSGWALYAEAKRTLVTNYPDSKFPNAISRLIDEERRAVFAKSPHYESHYYLSLIYLPPEDFVSKLGTTFLSAKEEGINYEKLLTQFQIQVNQFVDLLSRVFVEVELIAEGEFLTYLHSTISNSRHEISVSEVPMYLDALLADSPLLGGFHPKLGDENLGVIGILGFPGYSQPCILDQLNHLGIEYRWVTRFIFLDKAAAKRELETYQRKWFAKRKGVTTIIRELLVKEESSLSDSEALQKAEDAKDALSDLGTDEVAFGYLTTNLIVKSPGQDSLRAQISEIQRIINGLGFVSKLETVNSVDAWLGSIPGNVRNNVRRPIVNTINLSHLLPGVSAGWSGPESNSHLTGPPLLIAETEGATPFRLSLHVGDVGHTLILGPTGSGKSTLLNLLAAQFLRYPNAQVYIFDKGCSAFTLTAGVGGDFYDLGEENNKLFFQPLGAIESDSDRKWAHDWLIGIASSENLTITPEIKKALWEALTTLASAPVEQRTLQTFTVYLQDLNLRAVFEPYTMRGPYGRLFDNRNDTLLISKWQTFEMERLMETPSVVPPVLDYLFHRLEQRFDGSPTLLILDEAWLFLDSPHFSQKIRDWLKTLRKKNVSVIFATQSLVDVDASPIAATIKEACFTKIYLPNSSALNPDAAERFYHFGLNDRQIEILAYGIPKRDFYYTSRLGNRLFSINLGSAALAYCSGASEERKKLVLDVRRSTFSTEEFNQKFLTGFGLEFPNRVPESKEAA